MTLPLLIPGYIFLKCNRFHSIAIKHMDILPLRGHVALETFVRENMYKHDVAASQLAALGPILMTAVILMAAFILIYIGNYAYLNHVNPIQFAKKEVIEGEEVVEVGNDTGRKYFPVIIIMALTFFLCLTCNVTKVFTTIQDMRNSAIAVQSSLHDTPKLVEAVSHMMHISPPSIDMRADPSVCGSNPKCVSVNMAYPEEIKTYPHFRRVFIGKTLSPLSKSFWQITTPYGIIDPIDFWKITH